MAPAVLIITVAVLTVAGPALALKKDHPMAALILLGAGMTLLAAIRIVTGFAFGVSLGYYVGAAPFVAGYVFIYYRSVVDMRVKATA